MRRTRVLHLGKFYPPDRGGIETYLEALCLSHATRLELKVLVASRSRRRAEEVINGVRITRLPTLFTIAGTPMTRGFLKGIRVFRPEIVHIHVPNPVAVLAYLLSRHRGNLIVTYHSDVIRQKLLARLFEPFMQRLLRRANVIVVASPNYRDSSPSLRAHLDRCRVIPYGIDTERFRQIDTQKVAEIRRRFPQPIILSVGRLTSYKGYEYFIRSAKMFPGTVLIIGEGPERQRLEAEIAAAGVADRVHLLGDITDIRPYYHASDLFVLPSLERNESFGIVQIEAMACGLPVINTRLSSGVPYVSLDQVTGLTVTPGDAEDLGEAVNTLLADPELRKKFGAAGRRRAEENFRADTMAERTFELYGEFPFRLISKLA